MFETKATNTSISPGGKGTATWIAAVTGIRDLVDDVLVPGCFAATLVKNPDVKVHNNHDKAHQIGRVVSIQELMPGDPELPARLPDGKPWPSEAGALVAEVEYNLNTQYGRDAYEEAKFSGSGCSIGYRVTPGGSYQENGIRFISDCYLAEITQTVYPANPAASVIEIKSALSQFSEEEIMNEFEIKTCEALEIKVHPECVGLGRGHCIHRKGSFAGAVHDYAAGELRREKKRKAKKAKQKRAFKKAVRKYAAAENEAEKLIPPGNNTVGHYKLPDGRSKKSMNENIINIGELIGLGIDLTDNVLSNRVERKSDGSLSVDLSGLNLTDYQKHMMQGILLAKQMGTTVIELQANGAIKPSYEFH